MVKIRNGEYVSLAKVEMAIKKLLIVDNCCVCASSKERHTIALIVPNTKEISVSLELNLQNQGNFFLFIAICTKTLQRKRLEKVS